MVSVPIFMGASTYAIGKVFVKHYDEGGTIFDLNIEAYKEFKREQMRGQGPGESRRRQDHLRGRLISCFARS